MRYAGIILHHSACPSINGKGFDFFVTKHALVVPSPHRTDPDFIHICLEGDFSRGSPSMPELEKQLFVLNQLRLRLQGMYQFHENDIFPHNEDCPGDAFPWAKLVISPNERYH